MEQGNEHINLSFLREKVQKLLNWDPNAMSPDIFKNKSLELLGEYQQCQLRLEKQYQDLNQIREKEEKIASEKYAELFDFSPTGFFTVTEEGEIINLNRTAASLLNKEKEDLINAEFFQFLTKDSQDSFSEFLTRVFKKQGTETCILTFLVARKKPVYAQINGVANHHENQCLISVADVTQLTKARELQELEILINSTTDPIWSVKNDYTLIAANKAFLKWMMDTVGVEFSKGDDILSPQIFNDKSIGFWKENYSRALKGESFLLETQEQVIPGRAKEYFQFTLNPIFVNDKVKGVTCFARDITEDRKNKEEILDINTKLQSAQKIAGIGYWKYNLKSKKLFWSPNVYKIWEQDKSGFKLSMSTYLATIHPRNRPDFNKFQKAAQQGEKHLDVQYRIVLKNGKIKWIRETGILLKESGKTSGIYEGIIQDITSQKEHENNILNINKKLRSLISHLQNLQEEDRTSISREFHDILGQQLTAIKLDAAWLKGKIIFDSTEKEDRVNRLIENVNITIENVRRIATALRPGVLDDLGLEAAVEWLCSHFQEQTGIKCILETSTIAPGYSEATSTAVYRIFQETLTNVGKHAKATEVRTILKDDGSNLNLIVMDNGKGIGANNGIYKKNSLEITGMKERAWMLDGAFSIKRRKEGGTIMSLSIPLKN